jgi:hypothetical protein
MLRQMAAIPAMPLWSHQTVREQVWSGMSARVSLRRFARLMTHAGVFIRFGFREWFGQPTTWLPVFEQSYHSCSVFMNESKSVWPSNDYGKPGMALDRNRSLSRSELLSLAR